MNLKMIYDTMKSFESPKVGIFWYSKEDNSLFGILKIDVDTSKDWFTVKKLHKSLWQKEKFRRMSKGEELGLYKNDYKDVERGRVFYCKDEDIYRIMVGDWIDECPDAKELILEEFDLFGVQFEFVKDEHWNIGNGFEYTY